eukprot:Rmarinus@m.14978
MATFGTTILISMIGASMGAHVHGLSRSLQQASNSECWDALLGFINTDLEDECRDMNDALLTLGVSGDEQCGFAGWWVADSEATDLLCTNACFQNIGNMYKALEGMGCDLNMLAYGGECLTDLDCDECVGAVCMEDGFCALPNDEVPSMNGIVAMLDYACTVDDESGDYCLPALTEVLLDEAGEVRVPTCEELVSVGCCANVILEMGESCSEEIILPILEAYQVVTQQISSCGIAVESCSSQPELVAGQCMVIQPEETTVDATEPTEPELTPTEFTPVESVATTASAAPGLTTTASPTDAPEETTGSPVTTSLPTTSSQPTTRFIPTGPETTEAPTSDSTPTSAAAPLTVSATLAFLIPLVLAFTLGS